MQGSARGSEWRRWDLHVHTPESVVSNFGDWDSYVRGLIAAARKHQAQAIALADYFTIGGYRKILADYYDKEAHLLKLGDDSINLFIIPGVELRLNIFNDDEESINLHVLFDPDKCTPDLIEARFLEKLSIEFRGQEFEMKDLNLWAIGKSIGEGSALNITQDFGELTPEQKDGLKKTALKAIVLTKRDVFAALKDVGKVFESLGLAPKHFMVGIAGKGHGGLRSLKWFDGKGGFSRAGVVREDLTNLTDFIFSNDPADRSFYLGKKDDTPSMEIQARFGELKPCVWGSDSHNIDNLLHPSAGASSDYTWIKADLTFQGLKQILFEPGARVRIQEEEPDVKTGYLVLDRVRFIDSTGAKRFPTEPIYFNPNLNCVIGGKSSGKSLLLYHIAKVVDPKQVEEKIKGLAIPRYNFEDDGFFDFEVTWKDGTKRTLKDSAKQERRITYLPQLFINKLAEERGEQGLYDLTLETLLQDKSFKEFYESITETIRKQQQSLQEQVIALFSTFKERDAQQQELTKLGDKKSVQTEIVRLKTEIDVLRTNAKFSPEEDESYKKLIQRRDSLETGIKRNDRLIEVLDALGRSVSERSEQFLNSMFIDIEIYDKEFEGDVDALTLLAGLRTTVDSSAKAMNDTIVAYQSKTLGELRSSLETLKLEKQTLDEEIRPLLDKIGNQNLLGRLQSEVESETLKLQAIESKEKQIQGIDEKVLRAMDEIPESYKRMLDGYLEIRKKLSGDDYKKIEDIELRTRLGFNAGFFSARFEEMIDKKSTTTKSLPGFNEDRQFVFNEGTHLQSVNHLVRLLAQRDPNTLKLKIQRDYQPAMLALVEDYFKITFELIQDNDPIANMSPGKRGLVLLKLYLHLSNSRDPILIDQPEESLDNRTVYRELTEFIRQKKTKRQIVIVSHNANMVVSTDSEEVIVANQSGQQIGRDNREFQFEFVSGALESSFERPTEVGVLYQMGIREHVCEILEGGPEAFKKRERKYGLD